jgi:hypothetical protein
VAEAATETAATESAVATTSEATASEAAAMASATSTAATMSKRQGAGRDRRNAKRNHRRQCNSELTQHDTPPKYKARVLIVSKRGAICR